MSSEYSRSVDDWQDERWIHHGVNLMYNFLLKNRNAKKEAKRYNMSIEDYARETSDEQYPMMLYAYPLMFAPSEEQILKVCKNTSCTVVEDNETGDYYLALTGGGMDLSQDIAYAYMLTDGRIPHSLAINVNRQPGLSVSKSTWLKIAKQIKEQIKQQIENDKEEVKRWDEAIKEFNRKRKEVKNV
jgi:hypothetical protein